MEPAPAGTRGRAGGWGREQQGLVAGSLKSLFFLELPCFSVCVWTGCCRFERSAEAMESHQLSSRHFRLPAYVPQTPADISGSDR